MRASRRLAHQAKRISSVSRSRESHHGWHLAALQAPGLTDRDAAAEMRAMRTGNVAVFDISCVKRHARRACHVDRTSRKMVRPVLNRGAKSAVTAK